MREQKNLEEMRSHEEHKPFPPREGYVMERFTSTRKMYERMEELRSQHPAEVHGWIDSHDQEMAFYYSVGESETMTFFNEEQPNSWHSHPDTQVTEVMFDPDALPSDTPDDIRYSLQELALDYDGIDQVASEKVSLLDMINFALFLREQDLVSLPGELLKIEAQKSTHSSAFMQFSRDLRSEWNSLTIKAAKEDRDDPFVQIRVFTKFYLVAIRFFQDALVRSGWSRATKMTTDNFKSILTDMGLVIEVHKLEG